jgi:hypothetical protein
MFKLVSYINNRIIVFGTDRQLIRSVMTQKIMCLGMEVSVLRRICPNCLSHNELVSLASVSFSIVFGMLALITCMCLSAVKQPSISFVEINLMTYVVRF